MNYLYLIGEDTDRVITKGMASMLGAPGPQPAPKHFPFTLGVSIDDPKEEEYSRLILFHSEGETAWPVQHFVDIIHPYDKEGNPKWKDVDLDLENNSEFIGQLLILKKDLQLTKMKIAQMIEFPNKAILDSTHDEPCVREICKYLLTHKNVEFLFSYLKKPKEDEAA